MGKMLTMSAAWSNAFARSRTLLHLHGHAKPLIMPKFKSFVRGIVFVKLDENLNL